MFIPQRVLNEWSSRITNGLFSSANGKWGYANDAAYHYDFDAQAKRLNRDKHVVQPSTASHPSRGSDTTGAYGFRGTPVPLNAANRDLEDMVTNFDVSRLPDYDNMPTTFCGHILVSKPSLFVDCDGNRSTDNVYDSGESSWVTDAVKNYNVMQTEPITSSFVSDYTGRCLLRPLTQFATNPFMPLFTTKALNYTTADISIKTIEKGQTFYGHNIKYGHYNEEHKAGGTITLEFLNDRYWSVLRTCYIWMAYIYLVSKTNAVRPSLASQTNGIIDYAGSIYYLVTDSDNHRIVYWEKLVGVFPKMVPFSLFSTEDNPKIEDKVSIEFDYGIKSNPCDPAILMDINMLSCQNYNAARAELFKRSVYSSGYVAANTTRPDGFRGGLMARSNVEAARPIIRTMESANGGRNYYLEWLTTSTSNANYGTRTYS